MPMQYRGKYSSKYSRSSSSRKRSSYRRRPNTTISGYGAYRRKYIPRSNYIRGRGGYYISGGAYARGSLGPFKGGAAINAGYSKGNVSAPKLTGLGAYNVSNIRHNVLIKPDIPQVRNTVYAEGGTIVRHREYLGAITTSATANTFKIQSYPLNPAQSQTFPWLSSIASNFEEYKPNGLMFEFRSTASDAIASSTNLALGQVMMCTQYDPTDPEFADDVALLNYTWAQSGKVSDVVHHYVECDPKQSPLAHLYTREGGYSTDSDLRFSDFGRFSIATSGLQGTSVQVGQLWVTYEFIMYKPKLGSAGAEAGGWFHWLDGSGGLSNTAPFGATPMTTGEVDAENNLDVVLSDSSNNGRITFPACYIPTTYMVSVAWAGDSTASITKPTIVASDASVQFIQHQDDNQNTSLGTPFASSTTGFCTIMFWVSLPADGTAHHVELSVATMPTNAVADVYIAQIPYLDQLIYG